MSQNDQLSPKQKHLIGVGASIAAGCEPCTLSYATAARDAGACERGIRYAVEAGLAGRERATAEVAAFAAKSLGSPEVDAAFRADRALLEALIGVAAAVASGAASLVQPRIDEARARGATDEQARAAVAIAQAARRGAERHTDAALRGPGSETSDAGCCPQPHAEAARAGGCGCSGTTKL
jgi:AhpD family alkylhydroperoxidase